MSDNEKQPRKHNIGLYFLGMVVLLLIIFALQTYLSAFLSSNFSYLKYGYETITEMVSAGIILIVMLLFKNSYVFTQEKESYLKSFKFGWPELALSAVFLAFSITELTLKHFSLPVIINLAIYCLFIGIFEEFLFRGWLLNEFLERFSDSKKEIIKSIILSSLVFGLLHFTNILGGHGFAETFVQVINATVGGVFLALVYYKTKNIWTLITMHAVWDFTLFLSESQALGDCVPGTATTSIIVFNIIQSIILIVAYAIFCYWLFKQTDLASDKKPLTNKAKIVLPILGILLYLFGMFFVGSPDLENYYTCPIYDSNYLGEEVQITQYHFSEYSVKYDVMDESSETKPYEFVLSKNGVSNNAELKNKATDEKIALTDTPVYDYMIVDNEETFEIILQTDANIVLHGLYDKSVLIMVDSLETIKAGLKEHVMPSIQFMGTLKQYGSDYSYPCVVSDASDIVYFDREGKIFVDEK